MAIDSPSRINREHIIILALVAVVILAIVAFIAAYCFRRSHRLSSWKKDRDLEEGKEEVMAARAMWPEDHTLKEGYRSWGELDRSFHLKLQALTPPRDPPVAPSPTEGGIVPPPLFHPGLKRSRTMPNLKNQSPTSRLALSYPHMRNGQITYLNPASPYSFENTKPESTPMAPSTTMQTRRPKTPELLPSIPFHRSLPPATSRREVHSIWSSGSSSIAPSSPSIYDPDIQTTSGQTNILYPAPTARNFVDFPSSPPASPTPIVDHISRSPPRDDSPTLHPCFSPYPCFACERDDFPLPSHSPPRSPSPVYITPPPLPQRSFMRTNSSPHLRRSRSPSPDSYRCGLMAQLELGQEPAFKIERWLDGSTGTVSAFGSFMAMSEEDGGEESEEHLFGSDVQEEKKKNWDGKDPKRVSISPIRGMRTCRRGSEKSIKSAKSVKRAVDVIGTAM